MTTVNLTVPTGWNKLSRSQLLHVARLFLAGLSADSFRVRVFLHFSGIELLGERKLENELYYVFLRDRKQLMIGMQQYQYFLKSVDFLLQESRLTTNLFPCFNILGKRFYGPSNCGYNITWLEFIHAESCFYGFTQTRNISHLNNLCAVLYRSGKKYFRSSSIDNNGDPREIFNDFTYQRRARWFRFLSPSKRFSVFLFYSGFRNLLVSRHPHVFSSSSVSSADQNPVENLVSTMRLLNQGDITRNRIIQQSLVWEAFAQLNDMVANIKEYKKHGEI